MPIAISGTTGVTLSGQFDSASSFGFKNRIINGAMGIWQRGTSASLSNSYSYLTADRWETDMGSTAAATVSQSTSVPTATTQYSLKIQRTAASTSTGNIVAAQALETSSSYDLAGSNITLSFWAKCGANYSASSSFLTSFVFFGTGTDQSMSSMRSNAWTGQTNASQNNTVSTTWTRFSQTVSCPAGTTQVGMQFVFSPTGTAGADDSIYITGVQLEKGSTATSFDYRPYGTELQLCQRYYESQDGTSGNRFIISALSGSSGGNYFQWINLLVQKRATPTVALVNQSYNAGNSGSSSNPSVSGFLAQYTITTTGSYMFSGYTASAEL